MMKYVMHAFGKDNECDTETVSLILAGIAEEIAAKLHNVSVSAEVLAAADAVEAILSFADTFHPDLMITGCRKKTAVDALLLGSVSQKLLEMVECPIAIVRGDALHHSADGGAKVLVAVDDSEPSAAAIEWLQWQEWMKNSHIALLSVTDPLQESVMDSVKSASDHLLTYHAHRMLVESLLDKWGAYLQQSGNAREITRGTVDGSAAETILKGAHNWRANLIVMGAHGRSGLAKFVLGSVSKHISSHADCSVLIVKGTTSKHFGFDRQKILDNMVLDDIAHEKPTAKYDEPPSSMGTAGHVPPSKLF